MSGYIYDWQLRWSNDPECPSPPTDTKLFLDGEEITDPVSRCITGRHGVVEIVKCDEQDKPVIIHGGIDRIVRTGHVDIVLPEWYTLEDASK